MIKKFIQKLFGFKNKTKKPKPPKIILTQEQIERYTKELASDNWKYTFVSTDRFDYFQ